MTTYVKNSQVSQVIGPCYMQQRLLICPCYVDSVPERTTLASKGEFFRLRDRFLGV